MKALLLLFCISLIAALPFEFDFNVAQNEKAHHTSEYKIENNVDPSDNARMIVRRGQTFTVYLADDEYPLSFMLVPWDVMRGVENRKFPVTVSLVNDITPNPTEFQVKRTPSSAKTQYEIYIPYNAPVSMYHWYVVNGSATPVPLPDNELVILFNPWSQDDDVYVSDPTYIQEYVQNSDGVLWHGSANRYGSMGWDYAQFHYTVLEVTLYFLSNVAWQKRGDVISVSRALSSYINVNDNNGLVWGRWSGSYSDGKEPTYWTGSLEIFQKYKSTLSGVKYGQCWVFGGCLTSAGRSLGIPARTLTNFASAHESPSSDPNNKYPRSLDMFLSSSGGYLSTEGGSIWNFHVWCEFWMARRDLQNKQYNGWQAVDATPQERSSGLMQMGPAPVAAAKAVDTLQPYDTDFVTSEVSSSVTKWIQYNTGNKPHPYKQGFWLLEVATDETGLLMSTKKRGSIGRDDITSNYKQVTRAFPRRSHYYRAPGISFEIVTPSSVNAGENFNLSVVAECPMCSPNSKSYLEISGLIRMITYTGDQIKVLRNGTLNLTLDDPYEFQSITVMASEYLPYFTENNLIEYFAFVKYYENGIYNNSYALKSGRFDLVFPALDLSFSDLTPGTFNLDVSWKNPLNITLTQVILRISGAYIAAHDTLIGTVAPFGSVDIQQLEVYHYSEGEEILVFAKLLSNEIPTQYAQLVVL